MTGEPVVNNKVLIPRGEVVTDLKNQRWIVGASVGVDGSRDIYAVARCDINEPENYPAVMIFKPHCSDPLNVEMQAHVCNPKTIEKWKKSKGIRHLGVTPILGVGSYKYNDEMHQYIITQRYAKNLQQLLASNDKGFIVPTVYRVIGQMFYTLEYIHSLGYYIKFDISSDKLLQSFTNPNDIYLDVINYGKTQECLTYRSGKFPVESPYGNLESILYNAFNWLKLPLPWQNDLTDENLVNKQKMKAFAHIDTFLRCVFGNFGVLNPIRLIMMELAFSDATKELDYKKFLSIIAEGARNLKNVQYNLDSSLNFDEPLKLRQISKLSRQPIPSFSEDSSDEKDSKVFKKMLDAKGSAENTTKKPAVPGAENNTINAAATNSNATTRSSSPILSLGKRNAKTAQNVTTPSAATTSTARVEPSKMTEPSKTTVNEVTQDGKPKESESQNEQQRTIPKSVSEVGASTSSNVQPEKNVATSDSIGSCKCKAGVVNDKNTVQLSDGSESHSKRNLEDESHKKENKIGNCDVKTEVIDVSSGDEVSTIGKPNLKVEKPEQKVKKESSEKNKDAEKEKRRKSRNKSSNSEDSDSTLKEKSLIKKKSLLKKKKKERNSNDSGSSDSDDNSSDSKDDGKSKSKKKKRKKHRSASSDSGATNSEIKKVKRKKSKKTIRDSDSDVSPTRDTNKKEFKSKRSSKRRQDHDSGMNSSRDSIRVDPRCRTSFKRRQYSDSDSNSPRHSSTRDSRIRTSPRRSSENKNESLSRNRKRSPSKYSEQRFSKPRDNSYSTKSYNNSGFSDSRYQSDSGSFRRKPFHNFKNSGYDQSSLSYGQASINTHPRFHNTNHGQHYGPPRSYQQRYVRGNYHARSRPPYIRSGSSQSRNDCMFLNQHETQPGQRWNFYSRSDGRSTSLASTTSSNLTEQKQTHNGKYSHEEAQLRNVNEKENGSGEISAARTYGKRDFKHNTANNRERHNEREGIEKLNRAEGGDDLLKKGLPLEVNKPPARNTDNDFERELRTVEEEDPMLAYAREDEVNEDQREPD